MKQAVQMPGQELGHELKAQELQRAFDAFNQVSLALTQSYQGLQGRVESLTAELAVANGELRRQYEEKEALSERLSLLLKALPAGVDYAVFDFAVNSGPHRAAQFLQRVVGVSDDGRIGPKTIDAVDKMPAAIIIKRLCGNRLDWLKRLKTWSTFGRGWTRRVQDVEHHALAMVGKPADVVEVEREKPVVPPKARHVIDDAATNGMDSTTILSSGGSVISTVLSALVENKPAQIILVCAAVVLVAYVVIERLRKGKRANEARDELDRMGV